MTTPPDLDALLETARQSALSAGALLRERFGTQLVVNEASHHDLKIQLDVDIQNLLTREIQSAFPEHLILGEEGGEGSGGRGYEWILDPIDGTVNLAYGIPHFCVSVACRLDDQ
ncbi:MAG: hypothetical protein PHD76_11475, partial [Methylacidiphilales bacterium]|nr:hypothetical protein [Candidatus Methylacidiphilales bacterium]